MKVLLRDEENRLYYSNANRWVPAVKEAFDFQRLTRAGEAARQIDAEDLSVVLHYEESGCELALNPAYCVEMLRPHTANCLHGQQTAARLTTSGTPA